MTEPLTRLPSRNPRDLGQAMDQRQRGSTSALEGAEASNLGSGVTGGGDATAGGGGGEGSSDYALAYGQIDQAGHDSGTPTYGALAGSINSSNKLFTVAALIYLSGTLAVWRNGVLQCQGSGTFEWVETTPGSGTFTFGTAPETGDWLLVMYRTD